MNFLWISYGFPMDSMVFDITTGFLPRSSKHSKPQLGLMIFHFLRQNLKAPGITRNGGTVDGTPSLNANGWVNPCQSNLSTSAMLVSMMNSGRWHPKIFNDMIWYDMIWYLMIWYLMIWYDMIWYLMIWYLIIWYLMIWYDMIWYDIWYDMIWYDMIWYDMIVGIAHEASAAEFDEQCRKTSSYESS